MYFNIFPLLNEFLDTSDPKTSAIKFTVVLDKGYRITSHAWINGGHFILQPRFAKTGERFSTQETVLTANVASDRAGNKRAVCYVKTSDFIGKGLLSNESVETLSNVWLA